MAAARETQNRLLFLQFLFRQSLRGIEEALALTRLPAITPAEKEALFATLERAVVGLPAPWFNHDHGAGEWEEALAEDDVVRTLLEEAITVVLQARAPAK